MTELQLLMVVSELLGTAAFAISGVLTARDKNMDIFGALVLGMITAVGGGILRDVIIGQTPPAAFRSPLYLRAALLVSLATFSVLILQEQHPSFHLREHSPLRTERMINIADSIGLAIFAVSGTQVVLDGLYAANHGLALFVGTISAVGGGVLRDMMAGKIPGILRKKVYALAAIIGSEIYYSLNYRAGYSSLLSQGISIGVVLLLRYLAIHNLWNLPRFHSEANG